MNNNNQDLAKKAAGQYAATLIEDGMLVGLGSGSTAAYFIEFLAERCQKGLKIKALATSLHSHALAEKGGIPLIDSSKVTQLDLTVDGADEIDPQKRMIKGGGGALLREKIVAYMSKEMVVIIDESKQVEHLGKMPIPTEIAPFAHLATEKNLAKMGFRGHFRKKNGDFYKTDNGNYILDIACEAEKFSLEETEKKLKQVPGVLETGLFFNLAGRVIVGLADGTVLVKV